MDVIPDRRRRIAQGRTSACILNTEARSVSRPNVGRQTRRPTLRNVYFVTSKELDIKKRIAKTKGSNSTLFRFWTAPSLLRYRYSAVMD